MLIPDNIHPEATVYFNGAVVLRVAQRLRAQPVFALYHAVQGERAISLPMFVLCLDWLFLLNLVRLNPQGDVELCS
jgi:hypothetical protein